MKEIHPNRNGVSGIRYRKGAKTWCLIPVPLLHFSMGILIPCFFAVSIAIS